MYSLKFKGKLKHVQKRYHCDRAYTLSSRLFPLSYIFLLFSHLFSFTTSSLFLILLVSILLIVTPLSPFSFLLLLLHSLFVLYFFFPTSPSLPYFLTPCFHLPPSIHPLVSFSFSSSSPRNLPIPSFPLSSYSFIF